MTGLEKAARALYEERYSVEIVFGAMPTWDEASESDINNVTTEARAVISSIEVDDAMVEVAAQAICQDRLFEGRGHGCGGFCRAKAQFGDAARAALKAFLRSLLEGNAK